MTKQEAAKLVALLVAGWPRGLWPEETRTIYEQEIVSLDIDIAKAAMHRLLRSQKFQPAVAEVFETCQAISAEHSEAYNRLFAERSRALAFGLNQEDDAIYRRKLARYEAIVAEIGRVPDPELRLLPAPVSAERDAAVVPIPVDLVAKIAKIGKGPT